MLKSLTARAIVPVALSVTGFMVLCCILLYTFIKSDLTNEAIINETNLADTVVKSSRYAMLKSDREMLANIITNIGQQNGVEHLRIFNKKGIVMFSRDPKELNRQLDMKSAGCVGCHEGATPSARLGAMKQARRFVNEQGTRVIAITAPIYNEPACYNAACHVHGAGQKILGTLDIGLSAATLNETLWMLRVKMIIFTIMILMLTVGGVSALLQRNVFIPLHELEDYVAKVYHGTLTDDLPPISGELNELACEIRDIAHKEQELEAEKKSWEFTEKKLSPGRKKSPD